MAVENKALHSHYRETCTQFSVNTKEGSAGTILGFTEEAISEVSLQNCNRANKVHKGAEKMVGGRLPGGRLYTSRDPAVWTTMMSQEVWLGWSLGYERGQG